MIISHGIGQMASPSVRKQEGVNGSADKDTSIAKELPKYNLVWKLFIVALLGGCLLYACLSRVEFRVTYPEEAVRGPFYDEGEVSPLGCPESSAKGSNFVIRKHYPQPKNYSREECACTPVHFFVILSMQRSGSGWFETLLNDHPNISSHGEVFSKKERRQNFTTIRQTLDSVYNLDWQSSSVKNSCTTAVGHKWMLNQGVMEYHREVAAYYEEKGVQVIVLLRRNLLKRLVSILANAYDRQAKPLNGTHKSHVHKPEEAKVLAAYKPKINVQNLPGNLRRVSEITGDALVFFNSSRLTTLYYEDLVKEPKIVVDIQKFLGVPPRELSSKQVKIHTASLNQHIENWEEVRRGLNGTEFEGLLLDNDYS